MEYEFLKYGIKLPNNYHKAFIQSFDIDLKKVKKQARENLDLRLLLSKRKSYLNDRFDYNKKNILKFEALSANLTKIQNSVIQKHNFIENKCALELKQNENEFTDIYLGFSISFIFYIDELEIYTSNQIYSSNFNDEISLEHQIQNYADYEALNTHKKKFQYFYQSRLFHHLMQDSYLALQDILLIDNVIYDIKVNYQTENFLK